MSGTGGCSASIGFAFLVCAILIAGSYVVVFYDGASLLRPLLLAIQGEEAMMSELRSSLAAVARNRTVILTTLNKSWAENGTMIDLFLDSFRQGIGTRQLLDHLLIVNLDQAAFNRCREVHPHCFSLSTEGVDFSAEKVFMSGDYLKMMWRRVEFLSQVLALGYNFVFTDADIMWFRDPFPHFDPKFDFEIACDRFNGHETDLHNLPNGGFVHVISNRRTNRFYKTWFAARLENPQHHDQDVFNDIKFTPEFAKIKLRVRFLDTRYFGGFCEVSQDFDEVSTMHANCCTKLERKLVDLKLVMEDWARYRGMSPESKAKDRVFWRAPRECLNSWKS